MLTYEQLCARSDVMEGIGTHGRVANPHFGPGSHTFCLKFNLDDEDWTVPRISMCFPFSGFVCSTRQ